MKLTIAAAGAGLLLASNSLLAQTPGHPDPLGENLFPPELVMRFQSEIELAQEQLDSVRAEMERLQPRFEELQRQLRIETDKLAELLRKVHVEQKAALAQFEKIQNLERDIKRAHLTLVIDLKNRLTAEQQAKLRDLKKKFADGKPPAAIRAKLEKVKAVVEDWQSSGRDPSPIAEIMQEFDPLMKAGKVKEAEAVLDKALKALQQGQKD